MSNASSAIDTPSAPLRNFTQTWSTRLSSETLNLVTITSIETQTVHPTWVYTISESVTDSSTAATVDFLSLTLDPTPVTVTLATTTQWTTRQDITTTAADISEPPISTLIPTTSVLPSQIEVSATSESSDHHSWHSDAPSSVWIPPVPLTSSSISLPSSSRPILPETATSSLSSTSSISTLASSSIAPSNSHSIPPSFGTATVASSSETSQADNSSPTSSRIGTIVGSVIGGSAIVIFALLACALYMRRRRRRITRERQGLRRKLIRGDSTSSSISRYHHHCRHSYPSIPGNIGPRSPTLPVIPLQQQPSNPDLSLDSMYLRGETAPDPSTNPLPATIEISAPSRSVSLYSTLSRDAELDRQGHWDCECGGTDSLAVPHAYLDASMMRDSMRSDPFDLDLEPPPNAHHWSAVPSIPTTWAVKF